MSKYYNEKQDSAIIEMIFNQIILKKFEKNYYKLIKYKNNCENSNYNNNSSSGNDFYYQNLVFNTSDLMTHIFQNLEYEEVGSMAIMIYLIAILYVVIGYFIHGI